MLPASFLIFSLLFEFVQYNIFSKFSVAVLRLYKNDVTFMHYVVGKWHITHDMFTRVDVVVFFINAEKNLLFTNEN